MRVLVACEYSGRVRDAFRRHGHDAWSCDLLECEADPRWHYQAPVEDLLATGWDLMIAHPPCTHLAVSGSRHFHRKQREQAEALDFVRLLMAAPIDRWCIENPVSVISSAITPPQQIIQPWQFGHGEVKATCLWLKNLPLLKSMQVVEGREAKVHRMPPGPNRWKDRSRTYQGIADAMGLQWGSSKLPPVVEQLCLSNTSSNISV
jgi:site-specific DNA-cytosine methylase